MAAAAEWYRAWRDRLHKCLVQARRRDKRPLTDSFGDLDELESWGAALLHDGGRIGRLGQGELVDALELHARRVAVATFGASWVVKRNSFLPDRFDFGVQQNLATHIMWPPHSKDDPAPATWRERKRGARLLHSSIGALRDRYTRAEYSRVLAQRARLSADPDERCTEEQMLLAGLDPWRWEDLLFAFEQNNPPYPWPIALRPLFLREGICFPATLAELRRRFAGYPPGQRGLAAEILASYEGTGATDLLLRAFDSLPLGSDALRTFANYGDERAVTRVCEHLEVQTKRKRRHQDLDGFAYAALFLRRIGPSHPGVASMLNLLQKRSRRLHPGEHTVFACIFPECWPQQDIVPPLSDLMRLRAIMRSGYPLPARAGGPWGIAFTD